MSKQSGKRGGCGECVRVHRYTMSKQSGKGDECGEFVRAHKYAMSTQSGRSVRRMCTGTLVHYEQTVRGKDAASAYDYGHTGTL